MSSPVVLELRGVGKQFRRGAQRGAAYTTFREALRAWARLRPGPAAAGRELFWALRDLDLDLVEGQVLGVIGRNGAGKSTLLKLISRITPPTAGRIRVRGRVASLLEVGTGFHMELTGRDNVFLNGAILGMPKRQIQRKFDEIVEFAGVEAFVDTPVKHYSSGMLVRLAFAVAAHLDQELLLLDEVLAVGDANFQKRCIGKIRDIATTTGRTVVFVSHNNAAVSSLCTRGIVLDQGQLRFDGSPQEAIAFYNQSLARREFDIAGREDVPRVTSVRLDDAALAEGDLRLTVGFRSPRPLHPVLIGAVVHTLFGVPVLGFNTQMDPDFAPAPCADGEAVLHIPRLPLHTGTYKLSIWFGEKNENFDIQHDALTFDFVSQVPLPPGVSLEIAGPVAVRGSWSLDPRPQASFRS